MKTAVITGGSGAIGSGLVAEFAKDYRVVFTYCNNSEKAEKLAERYGAEAVRCDQTDNGDIKRLLDTAGSCDLLINNAGIGSVGLLTDISDGHRRIAAGYFAVRGIGIHGFHLLPKQHILRGGECTLHLIVHHAVDGQLSLQAAQLIMPALLPENFVRIVYPGIEYRIQIHMHQILKILVIAAGYGINCLIRICHGI